MASIIQVKAKAPKPYHHGDLKTALVDAGVEILRGKGPEALSLREVARRVGVSQAAPYRHFKDRRELIAAIAERGFSRMGDAMRRAMTGAGGRPGLRGVARAYVRFGLKNPAEYRVMFGPEVALTDDLPALRETGRSVLGFVAEGIAGLQKAGLVGPGDPWLMAAATWAMLHGLVMLSLDGQAASVASEDALVEEATRMMMFGMAPR
jgi:AcrR family transcriptional regulator